MWRAGALRSRLPFSASPIAVRRSIILGGGAVVALALLALVTRHLDWQARAQIRVAAGLLAYVLFLTARDAAGRFQGSAALRKTNEHLESEIKRRKHDLGDANARLR